MTRTTQQSDLTARSIDLAIEAVTDALLRFPDLTSRSSLISRWFFNLRAGLAFLHWAKARLRQGDAVPLAGASEILRLPLLALRAQALQRLAPLGQAASKDPVWRETRAAIAFFEGIVGDRKRPTKRRTSSGVVPKRAVSPAAQG